MNTNQPNDDSGPAFPYTTKSKDQFPDGTVIERTIGNSGMTLRDYFAAAAMQGILMNYTTEKFGATESEVAKYAYRYADAMLAARKATP